tara:strand:- start:1569 stop:2003 length:435 start_codon:yes stop_codon:yes gene_type:complete
MDKRKFNGGHKNVGRKKGVGITFDIQRHCFNFISEILKDDAIRLKATKQLSEINVIENQSYLYIIENNGLYKIGYTSDWNKRHKNYKTHLGKVNLIYLTKQNDCFDLELYLHNKYVAKRKTGEWFVLSQSDLLDAISYCSSKIV